MSAAEALDRITALYELSEKTGVATYKTRNQILASLQPDVMAEVAVELRARNMLHRDTRHSNSKGTSLNVRSVR